MLKDYIDYCSSPSGEERPVSKINLEFLNLLFRIKKTRRVRLNQKDAFRILWLLISFRNWYDTPDGDSDRIEYRRLFSKIEDAFEIKFDEYNFYDEVNDELLFGNSEWWSECWGLQQV